MKMTDLISNNITIGFEFVITIIAGLTAGLLIGIPVDDVIELLPAAMKQAWKEAEDGSPRDDSSGAGSLAARGDILRQQGPSWGRVHGVGAPVSGQTVHAAPGHEPAVISPGDGRADPARVGGARSRSRRRRLVQWVCGLAFALLAARLGLDIRLLPGLAATAILIALAFIDWDHHLLPDVLVLPLMGSGLLVNLAGLFAPPRAALLGVIVGYGSLWLLARAYRLAVGKTGIGAGDLKLMAALGAWLGWQALLPLTQIAAGLALAATLVATLSGSRRRVPRELPYGTYMAAAGWLLLVRAPV